MKDAPSPQDCPACGALLPPDAASCPACGFGGAVEVRPFETGVVLEGRYRIDSEVGRGGMGVVYRGTDMTLRRPVAIKAMLASTADVQVLGRFMREARALASVEHRGLVPVYAVGHEGGSYYMVMKFVEGRSLADVLKAVGALPPDQVIDLLTQVCDALVGLHRAGLIHRDLKPGNLMVGPDGRVTVMDLGIVKTAGEHTQTTSTALGTPRYMPPEMIGDLPVDGRADLYSLGIIAWQALVGEVPFDGPTPMSILFKQAHEPPPPLRKLVPEAPRALVAAVERVLAKDADDRFPDAQAFAAALTQEAPSSPGVRARGRWVLVAVLALVASAALIWALRPSPPGPVEPSPVGDGPQLGAAAGPSSAQRAVGEVRLDATPSDGGAAAPVSDGGVVANGDRAAAPDAVVDAAPTGPEVTATKSPRTPPARQVIVRVDSDPSGALVYDGGRRLGRTPLSFRRAATKRTLTLTLKRDGYTPKQVQVDLSDDAKVRARLDAIFELIP